MAYISVIWQQAAHATYQPSSPSCSTRVVHALKKQKQKKAAEKQEDRTCKKTKQKNKKTERAKGLGRKTREEIIGKGKQNSADSPEIPDRNVPSDIPGLLSGTVIGF